MAATATANTATPRRRPAAAWEWAAVSGSSGAWRVEEEVGKQQLTRRTGLPARDLRALDPALSSYTSGVMARDRAVVVNLERVRAVITADEVLVPGPRDPAVAPLVRELRARLIAPADATPAPPQEEDDGDVMVSPRSPGSEERRRKDGRALGSDRVLPFEFRALEVCLEFACKSLEHEHGGACRRRSDQPRMQYQHSGSRSRMAPFARGGGAYNRGQKQFYPPPPPPPLPAAGLPPPPPLNKYEVLMEAGRLAAEYLVAKGVLPPGSLPVRGVAAGGWSQLPPPPPPLTAAQEAPMYHNPRNDRRRADDEYSNPNARSRRNRGADYNNSSSSSNYNRRGKRKFGADNRYSDWGRDRERGRSYSDSRSFDDEDEDGAPGFRKDRRGSAVIDEVGSCVSGVAGEGPASKAEAVGESELEDTGSKVSSENNIQKNANAKQEEKDENEANKMQEDKVSDSEVVEQVSNGEGGNKNNTSSDVVQEPEPKHSPVPSDENVLDERHKDSIPLNEKAAGDEALDKKDEDELSSDEKLSLTEDSSRDDSMNLLDYCSFARVPKRPRSVLAHRNTGPAQREIAIAEQVDLVSSEEMCPAANDEGANGNFVADIQADSNNDLDCQERYNPSTACNQVAESMTLHEKETQVEMGEMVEHINKTQCFGDQENKEHSKLSPALPPCQNNLMWQVEKGIQIYNVDTPPQDEELIDSSDKGKTVVPELLTNIGAEPVVAMEEENLGQSGSFKIRDLNLIGSPDEIRNDPRLGQCSTTGCSMELQGMQQINFATTMDDNACNANSYALLANKEVIDIEDDIEDELPIAADACDTSKVKTEVTYPSMENMMNPPANTNVLHGVQDGYNIAIPDYLGTDMPCYQSIQTDLQAGMGLNDSESITVMEDPIYGSLGDIGFMEVWDQPPQDYEKFF